MKTRIWTLAIALICLLAFTACNEKKAATSDDATEGNETVLEAEEATNEDNDKDEVIDEEEPFEESDEEGDGWENEVWTAFGGTYIFFGDGEQYAVDFPLGEDKESATLYIRGEEYEANVNPKTGLITACDDKGNEVFRGAIYAGGNLLKGTYRGEHIEVWGSGD